jgi:2-dehydropantoate 2-reductase
LIDADVLVVGAGAIGGVTAAKMTAAVRRVVALDTDAQHVARLREPGLTLDDLGTERTVPLDAVTDASRLDGRFDFALVTLKAPRLAEALSPLAEAGRVDAYVSLGNGLVQERVGELVGHDRLVVGTVEWGATNLGPGRVAQTTAGFFVVGEPDGTERERTHRLAGVLGTVADVRVTDDVLGQVWAKLLVNSTFSGLGAVSGLLYREVAAHPAGRRIAAPLWAEGVEVARASGVELPEVIGVRPGALAARDPDGRAGADEAIDALMDVVGATKSSMLQDIERGAATEVDVINGGVADRGAAVGVPTPLNERVVALVHAIERGEREPSPAALDELAAQA